MNFTTFADVLYFVKFYCYNWCICVSFLCTVFFTTICSSPLQLQSLMLWNISAFDTPLSNFIVSCCGKFKWVSFMQWFSVRRQHALIIMADNLYYSRFRDYCKVNLIFKRSLIYWNLLSRFAWSIICFFFLYLHR